MEHCSRGHRTWAVLLLRGSGAAQAWADESAQFGGLDQKVSTWVGRPELTAALCGGSFYCSFLLEALAEVGVERL